MTYNEKEDREGKENLVVTKFFLFRFFNLGFSDGEPVSASVNGFMNAAYNISMMFWDS